MKRTVTQEDLVRYIYKETTPEENEMIQTAIDQSFDLRESFETLKGSVEALDCEKSSPSPQAIDRIMSYSRRTAPMETSL